MFVCYFLYVRLNGRNEWLSEEGRDTLAAVQKRHERMKILRRLKVYNNNHKVFFGPDSFKWFCYCAKVAVASTLGVQIMAISELVLLGGEIFTSRIVRQFTSSIS